MRWIDDAVQKGRDARMGAQSLIPVKTIRDVMSKQQEQEVIQRQRESEHPLYVTMILCLEEVAYSR